MFPLDLLGERARLSPGKTALVFVPTGERLSYAELDARATACAVLWRETWNLEKGDRVAILAENSIEFIVAFFAAGKSGVVLVPLSTRGTVYELAPILQDSAPRALLYGQSREELAAELAEAVGIKRAVPLTGDGVHDGDGLRQLIEGHRDRPFAPVPKDPDDLYCLLYTSGTTGRPKGVMIPHRMVIANGYNTAVCWDLRPTDVSPIFTPLYHAGGLGVFLVPLTVAGGTIVLHRGFDAAEVVLWMEKEAATVVLGVPTIFQMLRDAPELGRFDPSRLRFLVSGGAPLPVPLLEEYQERGFEMRQGYGLTEVGVNCFTMTGEESISKRGTIGRPMLMTEARILDEDGAEVATDEVGELCFRGPHVCLGYYKNAEATAAAFDAEGFFHTGDLARRDADGFYKIAGRQKDMIISGGVNIYPIELETALLAHPKVNDVAVVGVPDEKWGEVGVACVLGNEGLTAEELVAHLETRTARHKIPRRFIFLDELPRTPYGKVVKGELVGGLLEKK